LPIFPCCAAKTAALHGAHVGADAYSREVVDGGLNGPGVDRWRPSTYSVHMLAFAAIMAVTVYVILDLEYPRLGLIRVDAADQVLVDLRDSMK
jgi:hypothetical protein